MGWGAAQRFEMFALNGQRACGAAPLTLPSSPQGGEGRTRQHHAPKQALSVTYELSPNAFRIASTAASNASMVEVWRGG